MEMSSAKRFLYQTKALFGHLFTFKKFGGHSVVDFDPYRFMGKWYEIARLDHSFERNLTSVTAHYSIRCDGKVKVVNSGYRDKKYVSAQGIAKLPSPGKLRGELRVSFFRPFYAPYRILMLGDQYDYALVSSSRRYLWILSRTPSLDPLVFKRLVNQATSRGFDMSGLIIVSDR